MKKRLFFLPMVAIMMAACSSNETIEVNENKGDLISFRPIVKGVTRAADADLTSNGTSFNVEAFNTGETTSPYFSNVTYTNSGGTFTSATKYYWPTTNLDFYAYSPITTDVEGDQKGALSNGDYQIVKTDYKTFTIKPSTTVSEQVDFIYANTNDKGKGSTGEVTTLNFRHAGAKIVVKVKNSAPNLKFVISGWKLGYLDNTATFTYGDATTDTKDGAQLAFSDWSENTTQSAANTYSTTFTANPIAAAQSTAYFLEKNGTPSTTTTDEDLNMILIPQTLTAATAYASAATDAKPNGSYIALKMIIKNNTTAGETVADATTADKWAMWPIGGYNWEPGKKYTYTIDLAGGGYYETNQDGTDENLDAILEGAEIKFVSVSVDGWTDVEKSPAVNLAILKGMAKTNLAEAQAYADGNYYVDKDGNIHSSSETGYTTLDEAKGSGATGIIAYISNTDLTWDDGVNGGNGLTSQNSISFTGKNILILSSYFLDDYYGFDLNNTLIDTSITGGSDAAHYAKPVNSTVWFVPSKSQMISMGCAASGAWSGVGQKYLRSTTEKWTSTRFDESSLWALDYDNTYESVTTNNGRRVTPCYAY